MLKRRPVAPGRLAPLLLGAVLLLAGARGIQAQGNLITVGKTPYDEALAWVAVVLLVVMAGVFSGLTLGLMGLDVHGLEIVMAGSDAESARCAKRILPLRENGNLLLCTLLFGNVAVISLTSILMSDLTSGVIGFVASTAAIVLLGEILPQALCSRYALQTGARAVPLVKALMVLFYPVAKPVALLLDVMLGQELRTVYSQEELVEMLEIHVRQGALDEELGRTLQGALKYKSMSVKEAMTPINQVFMLSRKEVLGYETMARIFKAGFSRVPVYSHDHQDILGILLAKDLLVVDHSALIPVDTFLRFFGRPIESLPVETTTLGEVLAIFRKGRTHMVVLTSQLARSASQQGSSSMAENAATVKRSHRPAARGAIVGIITLTDVLQKILGMTILDEKDKEGELRRRMEARQNRRLIKNISMTRDEEGSSTVAEDDDDDDEAGEGEEEDEEKTEDWGALSSRFRHASEEGLGEEERQRYRMLNTTTWLSSKMKGLKEAARLAATRSNSGGSGSGPAPPTLDALGSSPGSLSSRLADRRPAPIQASGTPRACAAVSLLDLFHPTPQQGKRAQQRLEAMHLMGSGGSVGSKGGGRREFPFDDDDDDDDGEDEEGDGVQDSLNSAASSVATAGAGTVAAAAEAAAEAAGAGGGEEAPTKKKKKKLKHKLRKLYNSYFRGGQNVDLKNPEARGEMAGALSTFVAGERARQQQQFREQQQQQQQQQQAEAAAGGGGGNGGAAGHVAIGMEG